MSRLPPFAFRSSGRLLGMYGPPPFCKRIMRVACWSARMYPVFVGVRTPDLNGMRCALVLFNNSALVGCFRVQVSRAPGSTVVPSHGSPANLAGNHNFVSSRRRWSAIVGIAEAISKPGAFCQASIAGQCFMLRQFPVRAEAYRLRPWSVPPMPCAPFYWPMQL